MQHIYMLHRRSAVSLKKLESIPAMTQMLLTLVLFIHACSPAETRDNEPLNRQTTDPKKILIVYLSRTNNTKAIAEIIQKNVGGRLVALELKTPYPENYKAIVDQVVVENATGFLPPLKTKIDSMEKYDVIFLGFPTWGMQLPPPVKSFLKQNDLSGKKIVPFNTNGGYGTGSSFDTVKELCPNSTVLDGYSTKGGVERDGIFFVMKGEKEKQAEMEVKKWLKKLNLVK
jgi:flavodoxin